MISTRLSPNSFVPSAGTSKNFARSFVTFLLSIIISSALYAVVAVVAIGLIPASGRQLGALLSLPFTIKL